MRITTMTVVKVGVLAPRRYEASKQKKKKLLFINLKKNIFVLSRILSNLNIKKNFFSINWCVNMSP